MKDRFSYNLILLGGTGARCGEIFVHMCANGYLDVKNINILYIDSDTKNGNADYFKRVVKLYNECQKSYVIKESPIPCFFKPKINLFCENPVGKTVYFQDIANSSGGNARGFDSASVLMDVLYSEEEKEMKISEGFFAHPNVGAALFAANMDVILEKFVKIISTAQSDMKKIKIFLLGSIFGGTGASSLPTISKYLKKKLFGDSDNKFIGEQLQRGGCMVLPYFGFSRDGLAEKVLSESSFEIESDKFATKTKAAIEYYKYVDGEGNNGFRVFDQLYIIGHDGKDVRGAYETAGNKQRNLPHIVEFYSAMSCVTFFESTIGEKGHYFATVSENKINWSDVYQPVKCIYCFYIMMRFSIVMKSLIMEELFDYKQRNKLKEHAKEIPWYYDFIDGKAKSSDLNEEKLFNKFDNISKYCSEYIRWFAELNISNIEKAASPDKIKIDNKKDEEEDSDVVKYLQFFSKRLILKQFMNGLITDGMLSDEYTDEASNNIYNDNIKYIHKHIEELEDTSFFMDQDINKISMKDIWLRLSNLGFNYYEKDDNILKNIQRANDKSMDEGIKNLINAVYIACMI